MAEEEVIAEEAIESTVDSMSISEMFEDSKPEAKAESDESKVETKDVAQEVAAEADEPEPEEVKAETTTAEQGQLAALMAERDKRQKLEARIKELESNVEPEEAIDPIEDPQGYASKLETDRAASALKSKIEISQAMMTELDTDYLRLEGVFKGLVADAEGNITDEGLVRKFQQSANPAKFARDHAKQHEEVEALKDPKYKESLAATIRAEILAEIAAESAKGLKATQVPNLTGATASGSNSGLTVQPISLTDMFEESA